MRLELNIEEIEKIRILIVNRLTDLRAQLGDCADLDLEHELTYIIRDYKELLKKLDNQFEV